MKKYHHVVPVEPELFVQLIAGIAEKGLFRYDGGVYEHCTGQSLAWSSSNL
jgi:hypothetical protein